MPLYEFECPECSHTKELILSIKAVETEEVICEECSAIMRAIEYSLNTFILRGGGWAASGYNK
jgi:putative FmdB family regulatory protein